MLMQPHLYNMLAALAFIAYSYFLFRLSRRPSYISSEADLRRAREQCEQRIRDARAAAFLEGRSKGYGDGIIQGLAMGKQETMAGVRKLIIMSLRDWLAVLEGTNGEEGEPSEPSEAIYIPEED